MVSQTHLESMGIKGGSSREQEIGKIGKHQKNPYFWRSCLITLVAHNFVSFWLIPIKLLPECSFWIPSKKPTWLPVT